MIAGELLLCHGCGQPIPRDVLQRRLERAKTDVERADRDARVAGTTYNKERLHRAEAEVHEIEAGIAAIDERKAA